MTGPPNAKPPRPGGASGDLGMSSFCGDDLQATSTRQSPPQHKSRARLRLVPPAPPPRPRRLEVRISISDRRCPIGRSRIIWLDPHEAGELVDFALRLEAQRA
jgi:hypothetical protein